MLVAQDDLQFVLDGEEGFSVEQLPEVDEDVVTDARRAAQLFLLHALDALRHPVYELRPATRHSPHLSVSYSVSRPKRTTLSFKAIKYVSPIFPKEIPFSINLFTLTHHSF